MIKLVETPPIALYQSITGTSTSAIITPYPTDLDGVKLTYTDFGDTPTFTIDPGVVSTEEIISFTGITDNGDGTATLTGLTRNLLGKSPYTASSNPGRSHGATAVIVFSDNPQVYSRFAAKENNETITGVWTFSNFPVTPPSLQFGAVGTAGIVQLSAAPLSPTVPIAVSTTDTSIFAPITAAVPTGTSFAFNGRAAPSGYVLENGQGLAAASFPALFAVLYTPATVSSITIGASALVTTSGAHGFVVGDQISFTTTGGLPSGLTTGVNYWIISSGFTTTAFELATAKGGPAITTSGSQSGVHTAYLSNTGPYNGTTFYVPDMRSKSVIGAGQGTAVWTFDSTLISYNQVATFTNSSDVISTSLANNLKVGSRVEFSNSGGGLPTNFSPSVTYFVVRIDSTTNFAVSATPGGSSISAGSAGTGTQTLIAGSIYTGSTDGPYLGQAVVFSKNGGTVPTGLTDGTTYYVVPGQAAGEILLATSKANAAACANVTGGNQIYQQGKFIPLTALGIGVQTLTFTYSSRNIGQFGGEETHELNTQEQATHVHGLNTTAQYGMASTGAVTTGGTNTATSAAGGDVAHNNLSPFLIKTWIIKT